LGGVLGAEDGGAGDEDGRAGLGEGAGLVAIDATVHRDVDRTLADERFDLADFGDGRRDEGLAAEARVDGHDQDQVEIVQHPLDRLGRRRGIERDARLRSGLADLVQDAVQVRAGFSVDRHEVRARADEGLDVALGFDHHQVDVKRQARALPDGLDDRRADRDVGHEAAVHDVHVKLVGAAGFHAGHGLAQGGEIG
jgi:hypothetical protein